MGLLPRRSALLRWWIAIGLVLVAGLILAARMADLSGATVGIILGLYVALPGMVVALLEVSAHRGPVARDNPGLTRPRRGGSELAWNAGLNDVADELATAFPNVDEAEDIATSSGLLIQRVRTSRRADLYWLQILKRACDEGADKENALLDSALTRSDRPALHEAVGRYRDGRNSSAE
jgi:hypothetical protein